MARIVVINSWTITERSAPFIHREVQSWVEAQLKEHEGTLIQFDTNVAATRTMHSHNVAEHESSLIGVLTLEVPGEDSLISRGLDPVDN